MKTVIHTLIFSLAVVFLGAASMFAQDGPDPQEGPNQTRRPGNVRPNLLRQLGLGQQQMQQIRRYNVERRPAMEAAQKRFQEATRSLDRAIYADQLNEAEVQDRIKEVQMSQAELIKLRSMNELSIRRILTPEQLTRFRQIRQRFDQANSRPGRRADRMPGPDAPPGRRNAMPPNNQPQ